MAESLGDKVARVRRERGLDPLSPIHDADLVPDVDDKPERPDDDLTRMIEGMGIVDAYRRWCGKMEPKPGKRTESIMVSCPMPNHTDSDPSAWLNSNKGVWYCGVCATGGDAYDLAAIRHGFDVPGYKDKGSFPQLRERIAEDLGFHIQGKGKSETLQPLVQVPDSDEPADNNNSVGFSEAEASSPAETSLQLDSSPPTLAVVHDDFVPEDQELPSPQIDWQEIVPENTFLADWIETCTAATVLPDEYFFFLGLTALGMAVGNKVTFGQVRANFFNVLYGHTGIGKSRSISCLNELLSRALPYDHDDMHSTGAYKMGSVASGEALVDAFQKFDRDDSTKPPTVLHYGVKGIMEWNEFSDLVAIARRPGNTLEAKLLELYDGYGEMRIRSRGHGQIEAHDHFGSVVSSTQPRAVRRIMNDMDVVSGFANRWCFIMGREMPATANPGWPHLADLADQLAELRAHWKDTNIPFDIEGEKAWVDFYHDKIVPITRGVDPNPIFARIQLIFKKIMLAFAINEKSAVISADIVERACKLFDYLHDTYRLIAKDLGSGDWADACEKVEETIKKFTTAYKKPPTKRELTMRIHRHADGRTVDRVLEFMTKYEWITEEATKSKGNGRKVIRYAWVGDA